MFDHYYLSHDSPVPASTASLHCPDRPSNPAIPGLSSVLRNESKSKLSSSESPGLSGNASNGRFRSAGISLNAFAVVGSCAVIGAGGAAGAGLGVFCCGGCPVPFPPCGAPAKPGGRGCAAPWPNELGCWGVVGVGGSDDGVTGLGACAAAPAFFLVGRCCLELARIEKCCSM